MLQLDRNYYLFPKLPPKPHFGLASGIFCLFISVFIIWPLHSENALASSGGGEAKKAEKYETRKDTDTNADDSAALNFAQPDRDLNLAPMPNGLTGQPPASAEKHSSAVTDDAYSPMIENLEGKPDIHISNHNWTNAAKGNFENKLHNADGETPIKLRLAPLPVAKIEPIPAGPATPRERAKLAELNNKTKKKAKAVIEEQKKNKTKQTPEVTAACKALDAYKRNQLQAIESDRKTLDALRAAITELGLDKKLDFMTDAGAHNLMNVPTDPNKQPALLNVAPHDLPNQKPTLKN